jgi:hypothetical protein
VLTTLAGRTQPFRVTPKELPSGRGSTPEKRLLLPLLVLLSLQGVALVNLVPLLRGTALISLAPVSASTLAVSMGWALLNALLLLAGLRCCRDRPRRSATPWLAWGESVRLDGRPAQLRAISEDGLELRLSDAEAPNDWVPGGQALRLRSRSKRYGGQVLAEQRVDEQTIAAFDRVEPGETTAQDPAVRPGSVVDGRWVLLGGRQVWP